MEKGFTVIKRKDMGKKGKTRDKTDKKGRNFLEISDKKEVKTGLKCE